MWDSVSAWACRASLRMALRHSPAARIKQIDAVGNGKMINAITQSACQPGAQLFVAEEIAEDLEQDHQVMTRMKVQIKSQKEVQSSYSRASEAANRGSHSAHLSGTEILHQPSSIPMQRRSRVWVNFQLGQMLFVRPIRGRNSSDG